MAVLEIPQPYDFELSFDRFVFWGVDRANVWHEGGLHRVVHGREVRITPAANGVDVEPFDDAIEPVVRKLLGLELDVAAFQEFAAGDPVLSDAVRRFPGFRPPLSPDPFESLVSSITAQQVSLHSAFAVRSRFVDRFGEPAEHAVAFPTRERVAAASVTSSPLSASPSARRSTSSGSRVRTWTSTSLPRFPTTRSSGVSPLCVDLGSGVRTGIWRGISPDPRRGPQATSPCVRRCSRSTLR